MTYRSVYEEEVLNDLYARRSAIEDTINKMPGNRQYREFPGWVDLNIEIEKIVDPEAYTKRMTCGACTVTESLRVCNVCKFECGLNLAQAVQVAYGEAVQPTWESPWVIGDDVIFGSKEWFDGVPEVPFGEDA